MAEMLMDDKTKDLVLAAIDARSKEPFANGNTYFPSTYCIQIIYCGTPEGSAARRLLVKFHTDFNLLPATKPEDMPHDFLHDLALSLVAHRPLLQEFTSMKDESTRKEMSYRKQIATKDDTIQTLRSSNANLEVQKQSLETQKGILERQLKLSKLYDPLK